MRNLPKKKKTSLVIKIRYKKLVVKLNIKILIFGYLDVKRQNVEGKESKKGI